MSGTNTPMSDLDDLYGTNSATTTPAHHVNPASGYMDARPIPSSQNGQAASAGFIPGIPGLGMLSAAALAAQTHKQDPHPQSERGQSVDAMSVDGQTSSHVAAEGAVDDRLDTLPEAPAEEEKASGAPEPQLNAHPEASEQQHDTLPEAPAQQDTLPEVPARQEEQYQAQAQSHSEAQTQSHGQEQTLDHPQSAPTEEDITVQSAGAAAEQSSSSAKDATSALLDLLAKSDEGADDTAATTTSTSNAKGKQPADPEFLEAAKAQLGNQEAEWQYNTSDEDSSSDESSSDDSSDEDSDDEDYEMLDPAAAARMLMEDAGDEDDGGAKPSNNQQVRTKNEKPEEVVPKPDVTVTPDMQVTPLGHVENVVDNMILIKANTSGEYQVLEAGSVLCLENREVIGAVAETLGRVQEPLYVVAFTRPADIIDAGISVGTKVLYVNPHSTFVFTEPLKGLKGTDASNLHDEELPAEEMEFSDDEAEAAYKRAKKEAKKNRNAERNGGNAGNASARAENMQQPARPYTGGAINYDDEPEDTYTPLARPDNLQQILASGVPQVEERARQPFPGRGRGDRGRGRGRGDRGRGDRGRGRGGNDRARGDRKGPSKSFPDNHNSQPSTTYQAQPLPQKPAAPQSWTNNPAQQPQSGPAATPFSFPQFGQQQQQQYAAQPFNAWPQQQQQQPQQQQPQMVNPQQYQQFQQFLQNFGAQAGGQQFQFPPVAPPTPGGSIPAGAFVNPNFGFSGQQPQHQQQQQHQQYPQQGTAQNQGVPGPSPEAVQGAQELLRRLGNQQQQ